MENEYQDANDFLMGSGVRSVKFAKIGDSVDGVITTQPTTQQQRDPATGKPKFWDDGKPQLQMRVILQTKLRDPEEPEDDGTRALFVKSGLTPAIAKAVRAAGAAGLQVGGRLWVKFTGEGKAERGLNPPKLYEARYQVPAPAAVPVPSDGAEADDEDRLGSLIGEEAPF